jgi:hypothetical protein
MITLLEFNLAQDIVVLQCFASFGSLLPQTGHTLSSGLTITVSLHLEHLTGWTFIRLISLAMRTSPSVRSQLKNYLFVSRYTQ